jgi:hypothetical protein
MCYSPFYKHNMYNKVYKTIFILSITQVACKRVFLKLKQVKHIIFNKINIIYEFVAFGNNENECNNSNFSFTW